MNAPGWLTARPIAHRGLHDAAAGLVENTLGSARAAIAHDFAIECDVQLSADGEAMVFHDETLDRLTTAKGAIASHSAAEIARATFRNSTEAIPTLGEFLALIGQKVPLVCEIKSRFQGDFRLADRVLEVAEAYAGPLAIKSFDPEVIAHLRSRGARQPLGIVAESSYDDPYFEDMRPSMKANCAAFLHFTETQPDFLSWHVTDLPHAIPSLFRSALERPVMVWTVRTAAQKAAAAAYADQIVFEGTADSILGASARRDTGSHKMERAP